jgi:hypothetical protein
MKPYYLQDKGVSQFCSCLVFEDKDGYPFKLVKPLVYYSHSLRAYLIVSHGFLTDLASIPWLFQWLLPRVGRWDRAAVIHDYLYSIQTHPRHLCDAILREAMQADGVDWRRWLIWAGVRVGGWLPWYRDGKALAR